MTAYVRKTLAGWGNYPKVEGRIYRPEDAYDLAKTLTAGTDSHYIPRGLGRSYGDTALSDKGVLLMSQFSHYLSFDDETGVLEAEAGVSLADILTTFVPQGFFLPVTPGTKYVTLGGAIANDVHGKNHHVDGCFSNFVENIQLMLANGTITTCSRDEKPDLFWATVGGIGLTGVILSARVRLKKIESAYIDVDYLKAKNIDEAFDLFNETNDHYEYSVAWIDCLSSGDSLGRSVLMLGNHATRSRVEDTLDRGRPLDAKKKPQLTVPIDFPSFTLNYWSIKAFNNVYYGSYKNDSHKLVDYNSFFYPLDAVNQWNKAYGKNGFVQYQIVLPPETSKEGLIEMLKRLSQSKRSSFLAVLKTFGPQNNGYLSFPFGGYTLALDIPVRNNGLFDFLKEMDEWVMKMGGRIYLAKDAIVSPDHFAQMYPRLGEFKEIIQSYDPEKRWASAMSERLGITGDRS